MGMGCKPTRVADTKPSKSMEVGALYLQAEADLVSGKPAQALKGFERIYIEFPRDTVSDNALLRAAQIQANQKNRETAQELLQKFMKTYPNSDVLQQARRDLAFVYALENKCDPMMEVIYLTEFSKLTAKDQAQLSSRAQRCVTQSPDSPHKIKWDLKKFEDLDLGHPLYAPTQEKIIAHISDSQDEKTLNGIVKKYQGDFPAGFATYRLLQMAHEAGQKKKAQRTLAYFQKNFPTHPLALKTENLTDWNVGQGPKYDSQGNGHRFGVLLPLTGSHAAMGKHVLEGIRLAAKDYQAAHPQSRIELVVEDTQSLPEVAKNKINKLIYTDQVIATMGPLTWAETQAVLDSASSVGMPLITMSPKEGILAQSDTLFQNTITKKEQAQGLAKLLFEKLHIRRAAILYPQSDYGAAFMEMFWEAFQNLGGKIQGAEHYEKKATDFAKPIKKLVGLHPASLRKAETCSKSNEQRWYDQKKVGGQLPNCFPLDALPPITDFEALLVPDLPKKARQILPALKYHDVRGVQVIGPNLWNSKDLLRGTTGGMLEGAIFLDAFFSDQDNRAVQGFVERFDVAFDRMPTVFEAQAYDTVMFMMQLLDTQKFSSRAKLVREMIGPQNFENSITGFKGFLPSRDPNRTLTPLIVSNNEIKELY